MLKIPYQKLRLSSKGNLNLNANTNINNGNGNTISRISRRVLRGIPVLSIFVLVGMLSMMIGLDGLAADNKVYADEPIVLSESDDATASLSIGGAGETEQIVAGRGSTVYRTHTVTLNASNIESYTLIISGDPNMTNPSGSNTTDTITSTNGSTTGANLASNTWGYYYGEYAEASKESVAYKPLVVTGTIIDSGKPASYTINNHTRDLVFAAKFGEDVAQGRYYANVNLEMIATPAAVTAKWSTGIYSGINFLQEMTTDVCEQVSTPATSDTLIPSLTLEDSRDGNKYIIKKFSDGNCWMAENLRLVNYTLKPDDSNVGSAFYVPNALNGFKGDNALAAYYAGNQDFGAYYSWYTATAGTGTNLITSGSVPSSVCLKSWRLPTSDEYSALLTAASIDNSVSGSAALRNSTNNFKYAGFIAGESLANEGSLGAYWSSTAYNNSYAYSLFFTDAMVNPVTTLDKYNGFSVRCIADKSRKPTGISSIAAMQQMYTGNNDGVSTVCAASAVGDTATLVDTRDNSFYTVRKHSDGNCWMTQNLRITNQTVTAEDSDMVSGSFIIPTSNANGFSSYDVPNVYYGNNTTYGAYYSWYAATAGTGKQTTSSGNASASICPKGWKLPVGTPGTNTNDFAKAMGIATTAIVADTNYWSSLNNPLIANSAFTVNNLSWSAAGAYYNNSGLSIGTDGRYWSRTASSENLAYYFYFVNRSAYPAYTLQKYYGNSIRCVAYSS